MPYLDEFDLSRVQKEQLICTVWGFMESAVDQAFGVHPVQHACGFSKEKNLQSPARQIDSAHISTSHKFGTAANDGGYAQRKDKS